MYNQLISLGSELENQLRDYFPNDRFLGVSISIDEQWEIRELEAVLRWELHYIDFDFNYIRRKLKYKQSRYSDILRSIYYNHNLNSTERKFNLFSSSEQWLDYCQKMGYPKNMSPVIIYVKVNDNNTFVKDNTIEIYGKLYRVVYQFGGKTKLLSSSFWERFKRPFFRKVYPVPSILVRKPKNTTGTMGGLLYGQRSGRKFIVSCAHVLRQEGNEVYNENNRYKVIAKVNYISIPKIASSKYPCSETNAPNLRSIDIALAEIQVPVKQINNIEKLTPPDKICSITDMGPGRQVYFTGKSSGKVNARLGPLTLWDNVEFDDGHRCFGRIFQLKPIDKQYIIEHIAKPGDSGAWVILDDSRGSEWCGVVISSDGNTAYACFAETIIKKANQDLSDIFTLANNPTII